MRRETLSWGRVTSLLLAGLALRLLFFHFRSPVSGDSLVYGDIASNLLKHCSYALTTDGIIQPTLIRLPGYPLYLAIFIALFGSKSFTAAVCFQIIIDLVACYLLALVAARAMGEKAGCWALGLATLCPFTANYSVVPLTETLSIFCLVLGMFALERWTIRARGGSPWNRWLAVLSGAAGFAVLLRPDRALLFGALAPVVAWVGWRSRRSLLPVVFLSVVFALPLMLWGVRNWRVFHVVQPLSPKYANDPGEAVALGFMRWYRTWGIDYKNTVDVYWPYDDSTVDFDLIPSRAFSDEGERTQTKLLIESYNRETSSTPVLDAGFAALARQRIQSHPFRYYMLLPLARLADMWFRPRTELLRIPLDWWNGRNNLASTAFSWAYAALNAAYIGLAVIGLLRWKRHAYDSMQPLAFAMVAFVVLRSLLLATLDNAEQRYTIDCFPVVLLLASFAIAGRSSAEPDSPSC